MDPTLRNELIKIRVDKFLIALLIAIAGYILDQRLERYKEE